MEVPMTPILDMTIFAHLIDNYLASNEAVGKLKASRLYVKCSIKCSCM